MWDTYMYTYMRKWEYMWDTCIYGIHKKHMLIDKISDHNSTNSNHNANTCSLWSSFTCNSKPGNPWGWSLTFPSLAGQGAWAEHSAQEAWRSCKGSEVSWRGRISNTFLAVATASNERGRSREDSAAQLCAVQVNWKQTTLFSLFI